MVHVCGNHPNQQSAQAALNQDPSLAPTLDPDGDGVACEDFFGATASPTAIATATALADTGGPSVGLPLAVAAALALAGSGDAALMVLLRRSAS